jgi:hypothetical protein
VKKTTPIEPPSMMIPSMLTAWIRETLRPALRRESPEE